MPQYVEYNGIEIPFPYPQLGFYLVGGIKTIFGIEIIYVFTYLPAVTMIIGHFAFFYLATSIIQSKYQAGLASVFFTLLPRSMAWVKVEFIPNHPELSAKTRTANHYNELTQWAELLPGVRNYNLAVSEATNKVVFLHKIVPDSADRSYSIHGAQ